MLLAAGCGASEQVTAPQVTAVPSPGASEARCRAALLHDFDYGWSNDDYYYPPAVRKPVCAGFGAATIERLMDEALDKILNRGATPKGKS